MLLVHTPVKDEKQKAKQIKTLVSLRGQAKAQITRIRKALDEVAEHGSETNPQLQSNPPRIIVQQQLLKVPIPSFDENPENWPRLRPRF